MADRKPFIKWVAAAAAPAAFVMLASCATPFSADVARFQQLPVPQGQSFAVVASDPELRGGIEFGHYAGLVEAELIEEGYTLASDPSQAELIVRMDYEVDRGRERVRTYAPYAPLRYGYYDPFYGPRGHYSPYVFGYHDPFLYNGFGRGPYGSDSYTVYTSELDLKIERAADNYRLFEGKATAQSRSNNLTYLVPNLVEAMFTGFPGNSGEQVKITVAPEDSQPRRADSGY